MLVCHLFFFFNDTATTEIYTLSLHDALPISGILGATQSGLWHGTPDRSLSRASDYLSWRRSPWLPLAGFFPAQRQDRRDRSGDQRSQRPAVQHRQLRCVRAASRDGPDAVEPAPTSTAACRQESRHGSTGESRRRPHSEKPLVHIEIGRAHV